MNGDIWNRRILGLACLACLFSSPVLMSAQSPPSNQSGPTMPSLIRLTPDAIRKLLAVEAVLLRQAVSDPSRQAQANRSTTQDLNVAAAAIQENSEIKVVLRDCEWTGRDYLLALAATISALLDEAPQSFSFASETMDENMRLLGDLPPDLERQFAEWKRLRFRGRL